MSQESYRLSLRGAPESGHRCKWWGQHQSWLRLAYCQQLWLGHRGRWWALGLEALGRCVVEPPGHEGAPETVWGPGGGGGWGLSGHVSPKQQQQGPDQSQGQAGGWPGVSSIGGAGWAHQATVGVGLQAGGEGHDVRHEALLLHPVHQVRLRAAREHRHVLSAVRLGGQGHGRLLLVLGVTWAEGRGSEWVFTALVGAFTLL